MGEPAAARSLSAPGASAQVRIAAPAAASYAVQCPGAVPSPADILSPDDHVVEPEIGQEMLDGQIMRVLPALPPHGDRQCDISYVIRALTRPDYVASTELLTRTSATADFAADACIRRRGLDPATGARYLEELAFEVKFKQSKASLIRRAEELEKAGVRRIFAVHVAQGADGRVLAGPVTEWRDDQWMVLSPTDVIDDECLIEPLPVRALIDAFEADKAVAQALIERANPVLVDYAADSYRQGESHGYARGKSEGESHGYAEGESHGYARGLRQAIVGLCGALDIEVSPGWRARIGAMELEQLEELHTTIATERRWPHEPSVK